MKQKVAELINVIYGFRKFVLMLAVLLIAVVFRIKGYVAGSEFCTLVQATTLGFFGANGVEHVTSTVKEMILSKGKKVAVTEAVVEGPAEGDEVAAEEGSN